MSAAVDSSTQKRKRPTEEEEEEETDHGVIEVHTKRWKVRRVSLDEVVRILHALCQLAMEMRARLTVRTGPALNGYAEQEYEIYRVYCSLPKRPLVQVTMRPFDVKFGLMGTTLGFSVSDLEHMYLSTTGDGRAGVITPDQWRRPLLSLTTLVSDWTRLPSDLVHLVLSLLMDLSPTLIALVLSGVQLQAPRQLPWQ
jgi:hypothetical protein